MLRHRDGGTNNEEADAANEALEIENKKDDEVSPATALSGNSVAPTEAYQGHDKVPPGSESKLVPAHSPARPSLPPYGSLAEAFGYVVFLVIFVLATAVLDEDPQTFFFANRVSAAISDQLFTTSMEQAVSVSSSNPSGTSTIVMPPVSLSSIHDQTQTLGFLAGPFMDAVYGDVSSDPSDSNNILVGGVVLRTLRVAPDSCPALDSSMPEYAKAMPQCYGEFSRKYEQTSQYGRVLNSANVSTSAAYKFAIGFFESKTGPYIYSNLKACLSECSKSCGDMFGSIDAFRYAEQCASDCDEHCTCVYEQPAGFTSLCVDPNPDGAGAPIPALVYPFAWVDGATEALPFGSEATGAYVVQLHTDPVIARDQVSQLQPNRLLDLAARALVIDVTMFNSYLRLFNVVHLEIEFPPTGGALVSLQDVAVRVFRYSYPSSSDVVARITLETLVLAYIVWQWKNMVVVMFRHRGIRALFQESKWYTLSFLQLLAFTLWIALRLYECDLIYGIFTSDSAIITQVRSALLSSSVGNVPNLLPLIGTQYAEQVVGGICAALSWLKLLQYSTMFRRSHLLLRSLSRAAPDLFWFIAVFMACVCAFAQIGVMLFGLDLYVFRSLGVAIPTMLHAVAGAGGGISLDYEQLITSHRALGPLFYIGYYLLLLLIVINVFWAIVSDAYAQTLAEQEEEDEDQLFGEDPGDKSDVVMNGSDDRAMIAATEAAKREMDTLRQYPFSKGFRPALRLLVADIRRALYEMRTGRKFHLTKVDPLVAVVLGAPVSSGTSQTTASRKLDRHVRGHVERELLRLEHKMLITKQVNDQQTQIDALRGALETDVGDRLAALAESNERKTLRLNELEAALGAIEGLCRQLVADTAFLREDATNTSGSSGRRSSGRTGVNSSNAVKGMPSARAGSPIDSVGIGSKKTTARNQSLSAAILANRQRELLGSAGGSGGGPRRKTEGKGEEIEEISL